MNNEALFTISGLVRLVRPLAKQYANKPREKKKQTKQNK